MQARRKGTLRIGELAKDLNVERFVIRFWEKEFDIKARRTSGGQRYYTQTDVHTFRTIKDLLHRQKFTIAGARQHLQNHQKPSNTASETDRLQGSYATSLTTLANEGHQEHLIKTLRSLRGELEKVYTLLSPDE